MFANLQGIEPRYDEYFDSVTRIDGNHPEKLNDLAAAISKEAEPGDLIVFLDGDAFPGARAGPLAERDSSVTIPWLRFAETRTPETSSRIRASA